jgi:hypothetical protein
MQLRLAVLRLVILVLGVSGFASAQSSKPSTAQRAAAAAQGEAVIMKMMYGNYDPRTKVSVWSKPTKAALDMMGLSAGPLYARMAKAFPFQENGDKKLLFVTYSGPRNFDCHGCAPLISVALFSQEAGKWKLETTEAALTATGAWGKPGEFKMEPIGAEKHALAVISGFTAQGDTSETTFFYARDGLKFKQVLALETHSDNGGNCGPGMQVCYNFDSKYAFQPNSTQPYHDLVVISTGTRLNDKGKVVPAKKRQVYVFKNGEYKAAP